MTFEYGIEFYIPFLFTTLSTCVNLLEYPVNAVNLCPSLLSLTDSFINEAVGLSLLMVLFALHQVSIYPAVKAPIEYSTQVTFFVFYNFLVANMMSYKSMQL